MKYICKKHLNKDSFFYLLCRRFGAPSSIEFGHRPSILRNISLNSIQIYKMNLIKQSNLFRQSYCQLGGGTAFLGAEAWHCSFPSARSKQRLGGLEHFWFISLQTWCNWLVLTYQLKLKNTSGDIKCYVKLFYWLSYLLRRRPNHAATVLIALALSHFVREIISQTDFLHIFHSFNPDIIWTLFPGSCHFRFHTGIFSVGFTLARGNQRDSSRTAWKTFATETIHFGSFLSLSP